MKTKEYETKHITLRAKKPKIKPVPKNASPSLSEAILTSHQSLALSTPKIIPPIVALVEPVTPVAAFNFDTLTATSSFSSVVNMDLDSPLVASGENKGSSKLDPESPFSFISFLEKHPNTKEFVYMIPAEMGRTVTVFNPYNLRIVNFSEIDTKSPHGFYTMSATVY